MAEVKERNLNIRATLREKALLAEAARLKHLKVSQFVLGTALDSARRIVAEETAVYMSTEAYDEFVKRLDEEPQEIPALQEQISRARAFRD